MFEVDGTLADGADESLLFAGRFATDLVHGLLLVTVAGTEGILGQSLLLASRYSALGHHVNTIIIWSTGVTGRDMRVHLAVESQLSLLN